MDAAGPLDRLAGLDATGLLAPRLVALARRVPGLVVIERRYEQLEAALMRELGRRLESGDRPPMLPPARQAAAPPRQSPRELMDALLRDSLVHTPKDSERALVAALVGGLVPDEARILAALADSSAFPLVHVVPRGSGVPLLSNHSSVGRAAGVRLTDHVPIYVTHLLGLGLATSGAEDPSLREEYEILMTEPSVVRAAAGPGRRGARVARGTLRISELGKSVWAACGRG